MSTPHQTSPCQESHRQWLVGRFVVLGAVCIGFLDAMHAIVWRNWYNIGWPALATFFALLGYLAFSFTNFFRVAWPAAAFACGFDEDSYGYDRGVWATVPAHSWAEATACWWVVFAFVLVVVWSDAVLAFLPSCVSDKAAFELVRKLPLLFSTSGAAATAVLTLYHIDTEWSTTVQPPFVWWTIVPLACGEVASLVVVCSTAVYFRMTCPEQVWLRKELIANANGVTSHTTGVPDFDAPGHETEA